MNDRIAFLINRLRQKLWVRPLMMCLVSIAAAFLAAVVDDTALGDVVPEISAESMETLLKVISASMLVIATFAVASMVSAYASASSTATPRSFALVIADDVSQNALSAFIGAFIFSIVALVATQNDFYDTAGRFTLFVLTIFVFAAVILTFVRWVDRVARLGRLGATVAKVEAAANAALLRRLEKPRLGGVKLARSMVNSVPVCSNTIGYVQRVDINALQSLAVASKLRIQVAALPGTFATPGRMLAHVQADAEGAAEIPEQAIADAFTIGRARTFDEDPRFGLVVLSEIASRALSPGINDPGTAIDVIGSMVRLFALFGDEHEGEDVETDEFDRIAVPPIEIDDLFDDAFSAIARDGAGTIEVVVRLQKALESLGSIDHPELRAAAKKHARLALARAERALDFDADLHSARTVAAWFAGSADS